MAAFLVASGSHAVAAVKQPLAVFEAQQLEVAEREVPLLAAALHLKPGMSVADVGAGFGAWTTVFAKWLGATGHVYSTEIADPKLSSIRAAVAKEGLKNVIVVRSAEESANLPAECCDAILLREVYHHLVQPSGFNRTLRAALRPGGLLAIIDLEPSVRSRLPASVNPNRGGHGVPAAVVVRELGEAELSHVETRPWPPGGEGLFLVVMRKP